MPADSQTKLLTDEQVRQFIANGFIRLQADVAAAVNADIDRQLRAVTEEETWHGNNIVSRVPRIHDIVRCPTVHGALVSLLGPNFYFHPHRAIHRSTPIDNPDQEFAADVDAPVMGKGSTAGSGWHQDAQSPLSRARHHLPRYIIGFYFPHDTPLRMGPTRIQGGSHLFANPVEPAGVVLPEDVIAGTVLLVHFDMVHAGFPNRSDLDRYMVKFVFTRTEEPTAPGWANADSSWQRPQHCIPDFDLPEAWGYIWNWLRGSPAVPTSANEGTFDKTASLEQLNSADQPARLNATYRLAALGAVDELSAALLECAGQDKHDRCLATDKDGNPVPRDDVRGYPRRWNERAIAMEDAAYALAAAGPVAIPRLTELLAHDDAWVQINAVFGLGEMGSSASAAVADIAKLLHSPHQQVVRQALDALGAIGVGLQPALAPIESLLTRSNPDWQSPQVQRGWNGENQVRLNAAFALLNAINSGEDLPQIEAVLGHCLDDPNGYVAAVAAEGLLRIGSSSATETAIRYLSDRRWDDTLEGRRKAF